MEQSSEKPKRVEELKHFPFKGFREFKKASLEGIANIGVDRGVALQWAQGGIYSSGWLRAQALILAFLPILAGIGFIIFAIVTKTWFLLLALPVLLIGFFIFHPSAAFAFGFIRTGVILLTFIALAWGLLRGIPWLTAISLTLAVMWYAQRAIYKKAVNGLIQAAVNHEDLLCLLWHGKALNIRLYNGDSYWADWKKESGETTHYE